MEEFGKYIRKLRIDMDRTLNIDANALRVTKSYLSQIERGKKKITSDKLFRYAYIYGHKEELERLAKEQNENIECTRKDFIKVIRCKDCKWWSKEKDSLQGRCALLQMYPTGEWYCANAERKENA